MQGSSLWSDFGAFFTYGSDIGSLCDHFGITLGHFGVTLGDVGVTFGAKGAHGEGRKGVRRPTCKAEPVQGGCKEGAGRVQGECKESARRVRVGVEKRFEVVKPPREEIFDILLFDQRKRDNCT